MYHVSGGLLICVGEGVGVGLGVGGVRFGRLGGVEARTRSRSRARAGPRRPAKPECGACTVHGVTVDSSTVLLGVLTSFEDSISSPQLANCSCLAPAPQASGQREVMLSILQ